jgi:hypothetical protein
VLFATSIAFSFTREPIPKRLPPLLPFVTRCVCRRLQGSRVIDARPEDALNGNSVSYVSLEAPRMKRQFHRSPSTRAYLLTPKSCVPKPLARGKGVRPHTGVPRSQSGRLTVRPEAEARFARSWRADRYDSIGETDVDRKTTRVRARHCSMTRRHPHAPASMCLGYILQDFVRLLREYV